MTHPDERGPGAAARLAEAWPDLRPAERLAALGALPRTEAEDFVLELPAAEQLGLLRSLPAEERRAWMRLLPPDDAADLIQAAAEGEREGLLALLDPSARAEVGGLLAYAEDAAGGLMNPRFARLRPEMTVAEAFVYLRKQTRERPETIYYLYVLDPEQRLLGVVSFRELFAAPPEARVREVMRTEAIAVGAEEDQEAVSRTLARHDLLAVPVLDAERRVRGVVTVDDAVDVLEEEATEDIQRQGAVEALGEPYLKVAFGRMVRRRAGWLGLLFVGELLTASAMAFFEQTLARALVLALFVPLIISSGGNSGSQASTLVVRAMALGEVRLRDVGRVAGRELAVGLVLGLFLGALGFLRIALWQLAAGPVYGEHGLAVGLTVAASVLGVVAFGTLAGALLPFGLRRLGLDPATASAPFVATLVDVAGIVIYFSVATVLLGDLLG